jgi:hypothetical protein
LVINAGQQPRRRAAHAVRRRREGLFAVAHDQPLRIYCRGPPSSSTPP